MFARFDENPAMTLQDIKETKRYGRNDARTDNVKTVYPAQTKFAGGITMISYAIFIYSGNFQRFLNDSTYFQKLLFACKRKF